MGACDGAAVIGDSDVGAAEGATDVGAAVIGDSDVGAAEGATEGATEGAAEVGLLVEGETVVGETVGEPVTGLAVVGFLVCSQLHRRLLPDN